MGRITLEGVSHKTQPLKNILEIILFDAEQQNIEIKSASYEADTFSGEPEPKKEPSRPVKEDTKQEGE